MSSPHRMKQFKTTALVAALTITLSSCQTANNLGEKHGRTFVGCVGGTLIGGLAGALLGGRDGAAKGAAAGLAVGCVAGHLWDKREQELKKLAQEEQMKIQLERVYQAPQTADSTPEQKTKTAQEQPTTVGVVAQIEDSAMFNSSSAELTAAGQRQLDKLAQILSSARKEEGTENTPILVIGHTDNTGSADYNQKLSEQRAKTVVEVLAAKGFARDQLFFQGAGEGRPIADNTNTAGRGMNRRVELVELKDEQMLQQRIAAEQQNPRYIQKSAAHLAQVPYRPDASTTAKPKASSSTAKTSPVVSKTATATGIDFGGSPALAGQWALASRFSPDYSSATGLFSSAVASDAPIRACAEDEMPVIGEVKNLAGKPLTAYRTNEFLPGMNGKVWASKVNGHVVYINPVAVLNHDYAIAQQPQVAFTKDYSASHNKITAKYQGQASLYRGKDNLLMRVFIADQSAPIQCLDVLLPYGGNSAMAGQLYYPKNNQVFVTDYKPARTGV
ncbi:MULTISPECIES: OmpA family protein [Rheinheimera]|uniref:OmpA family protein n=1 Tax=Rheinheimera marina TaxID=1774958 RepID=A0ABV9JI10_9GAMM